MSERTGPTFGLTAEDWIKHWETDFAEVTHRHERHHGHSHHHHHSHGDSGEDRGCGSQKFLKKYLLQLTRDLASVKVLVSLCGDSTDVTFLASKGHDVTGIEISEKAVKSIFEKAHPPIPYTVTEKPPFKVYTATDEKKIKIYVGNFFDALPSEVGPFDAAWDGHGIVSLPKENMQPYADKLKGLVKPDGVILFSTVHFDAKELTSTEGHPAPIPISTAELQNFFSGYKVELLEDDVFEHHAFGGTIRATNPIHLITKTGSI